MSVQKTSRYRGVSRRENKHRPWEAKIHIGERVISLGRFDQEDDAALAFDVAARVVRKNWKHLNVSPTKQCSIEFLKNVFERLP